MSIVRRFPVEQIGRVGYGLSMICMLKEWITRPRRRIRLPRPAGMTLVTGARREMIDGVFDSSNRLVHLIVHTRQKSLM